MRDNLGDNYYNGHVLNNRDNLIGWTSEYIELLDENENPTGCYRTILNSQSAEAMSVEMQCGYDEKGFSSYDSLFRPISMDGSGSFPQYCQGADAQNCPGCIGLRPQIWTLTISGTTPNSPNFPDINGTFELSSSIGACDWTLDLIRQDQNQIDRLIEFNWQYIAPNWVLRITIDAGINTSDLILGQIVCKSTSINPIFSAGIFDYNISGAIFDLVGSGSDIRLNDLNPYTNPQGMARDRVSSLRTDTTTIGHDIDLLGRDGTARDNTPEGGLIMYQAAIEQGDMPGCVADYTDDYRGMMALRGPLVISGWGYDCSGNPIPNKNDITADAEQGIFIDTNLDPDKFLDNFLHNPKSWPVAPVDMRFDRERCVWTFCSDATSTSNGNLVDCEVLQSIRLSKNSDSIQCLTKTVKAETCDDENCNSIDANVPDFTVSIITPGGISNTIETVNYNGDCSCWILTGTVTIVGDGNIELTLTADDSIDTLVFTGAGIYNISMNVTLAGPDFNLNIDLVNDILSSTTADFVNLVLSPVIEDVNWADCITLPVETLVNCDVIKNIFNTPALATQGVTVPVFLPDGSCGNIPVLFCSTENIVDPGGP